MLVMEGVSHLIENVCGRVEQLILIESNFNMEFWLEKWKERYVDKVRQVLPDKNPLWLNRKKFQNTSDDDDDDDDSEDDDNDDGGDSDNGCEVERGVSLLKKRKEYASTLEEDTSRKKQKTKTAAAQANEDGYFWNEGTKLWTDGNMKFFRREVIPSVNAEDRVRYKYVEQNLGLNHDEELEVNASILGATEFGEYALVHPDVRKNMYSLGLGLDSLDG
jgi:hypothetical protein